MPTRPPAVLTAGQPPPRWDSVGTPFARCSRPSTPAISAVQPISAGGSAAFLSGWRMNRQPTSPNMIGTAKAPSPTTELVRV